MKRLKDVASYLKMLRKDSAAPKLSPQKPEMMQNLKLTKRDSGIHIYDTPFVSSYSRPLITETINGRTRSYYAHNNQLLRWRWNELYGSSARLEAIFPAKSIQWFKQMFLPVGYPSSCHPVYAQVHVWQFIETMLGSTVSVLCSEAMLSSLGISEVIDVLNVQGSKYWRSCSDSVGSQGRPWRNWQTILYSKICKLI